MENSIGYVYFVQMGENGPVKIGWAGSLRAVSRRVDGMQTGCPSPLLLRGVMPGSRQMEKSIHVKMIASRLRGEWFVWSDEVQLLIDAADAGDGVIERHRRVAMSDRMAPEAAALIWRDMSRNAEQAVALMPGWSFSTAKRTFGPRSLSSSYSMPAETARELGKKGGAVLKARAIEALWKSPGKAKDRERWSAVWRDTKYPNAQAAADAMPSPLTSRVHLCRRIFGRRDPLAKFTGGRPLKKK